MMWGSGWWLVGVVVMIVCMVVMMRMMGHGGHSRGTHDEGRGAEGTLADRLARGEIDVDEYERLLEVLRRPDRPVHI
jgi:uncharacterized membrane protein